MDRRSRGDTVSNVMVSLQHDVGKWCTEYTWSADDGMWGVRVLHNFGKLGVPPGASTEDSSQQPGSRTRLKRVDEEEAVEGGLKGRVSAGAEVYFSAKERSAGGMCKASIGLEISLTNCYSIYGYSLHNRPRCNTTLFSSSSE